MQQQKASQSSETNTQRILLTTNSGFKSIDCLTSSLVSINFALWRPYFLIVGSCNGLVCISLHLYKDFFIWNPSTGMYLKIPDPEFPFQGLYIRGFGYDSSSSDYKTLIAHHEVIDSRVISVAQVFSLKTNSWRKIQQKLKGINLMPYNMFQGCFSNGAIHWLGYFREHNDGLAFRELVIVAFDLAEEKFRLVPMPNAFDSRFLLFKFNHLGDVQGRLCLTCRTNFELWMMEEYGVQSSWKKLIKIETSKEVISHGKLDLVCSARSGEVILETTRHELVRYNLEEGTLEVISDIQQNEWCTTVVAYTESLVSPQFYL